MFSDRENFIGLFQNSFYCRKLLLFVKTKKSATI